MGKVITRRETLSLVFFFSFVFSRGEENFFFLHGCNLVGFFGMPVIASLKSCHLIVDWLGFSLRFLSHRPGCSISSQRTRGQAFEDRKTLTNEKAPQDGTGWFLPKARVFILEG